MPLPPSRRQRVPRAAPARDARPRVEDEILALTRLYAFLSKVNRTIIHSDEPDRLLNDICDAAVQHGGFLGACAWLRGADGEGFRGVARRCGRRCPAGMVDGRRLSTDLSTIAALEAGERVIVEEDGVVGCAGRGLAAAADHPSDGATMLLPLRNGGHLGGVLGVCAQSRRFFGFREARLLDEVAEDVSFALSMFELRRFQQQAERQLYVYRQMLRDASDVVLLVRRSDWLILEANQAASRTYGWRLDELKEMDVRDLRAPEVREQYEEQVQAALADGSLYETIHRRRDGSLFPVEVAVRASVAGGEQVLTCVLRDITERKQVEQLKSDFVSMVSHELRTPLAVILGNATLMERLDPSADPEQLAKAIETIRKRGEGMTFLVEDLLEGSTLQDGWVRLGVSECDLAGLVEDAVASVHVTARHTVESRVPEGLLVRWDARRMSQVLRNLLANAVKFSPEGGPVELHAEREGTNVHIEVRDRGVGIPEDLLERIFDRFYQVDMSHTRHFGGVGMGLYLAKRIVEAHGGTISVAGRPGEGSVFSLVIPLDAARDTA